MLYEHKMCIYNICFESDNETEHKNTQSKNTNGTKNDEKTTKQTKRQQSAQKHRTQAPCRVANAVCEQTARGTMQLGLGSWGETVELCCTTRL